MGAFDKYKSTNVEVWGSYAGEDLTEIPIDHVVRTSEKAVLVSSEGEKVWLPLSQTHLIDPYRHCGWISNWIANEKGFV